MLCNFIEMILQHEFSPVNLLHICRTSFPKNSSGGLFLFYLKGALMQIGKSPFMFVFMQKKYPENFAFLILGIFELLSREVVCLQTY